MGGDGALAHQAIVGEGTAAVKEDRLAHVQLAGGDLRAEGRAIDSGHPGQSAVGAVRTAFHIQRLSAVDQRVFRGFGIILRGAGQGIAADGRDLQHGAVGLVAGFQVHGGDAAVHGSEDLRFTDAADHLAGLHPLADFQGQGGQRAVGGDLDLGRGRCGHRARPGIRQRGGDRQQRGQQRK